MTEAFSYTKGEAHAILSHNQIRLSYHPEVLLPTPVLIRDPADFAKALRESWYKDTPGWSIDATEDYVELAIADAALNTSHRYRLSPESAEALADEIEAILAEGSE